MRCANSGLWRSVTGRGSHPTGSVTGCAARHEARHSPRLRLAPACSQPRPRPGVAELGVVRRRYPSPVNHHLLIPILVVVGLLVVVGILSALLSGRAPSDYPYEAYDSLLSRAERSF